MAFFCRTQFGKKDGVSHAGESVSVHDPEKANAEHSRKKTAEPCRKICSTGKGHKKAR